MARKKSYDFSRWLDAISMSEGLCAVCDVVADVDVEASFQSGIEDKADVRSE